MESLLAKRLGFCIVSYVMTFIKQHLLDNAAREWSPFRRYIFAASVAVHCVFVLCNIVLCVLGLSLLCTFVWMVRVRGVVAGLLLGVMGVVGWERCRLLGGTGGWLGGGCGVVETKACGANLREGPFADIHQN